MERTILVIFTFSASSIILSTYYLLGSVLRALHDFIGLSQALYKVYIIVFLEEIDPEIFNILKVIL